MMKYRRGSGWVKLNLHDKTNDFLSLSFSLVKFETLFSLLRHTSKERIKFVSFYVARKKMVDQSRE